MSIDKPLFGRTGLWLAAGGVVLILAAIVATIVWLGPLPSRVVVMSTGTPGSDYDLLAQRYKPILKRSGIELQLLPSAGSVENLARLNDPKSGVMVGFAQGGLTTEAQSPNLESLGTLFYEPLWFFYRGGGVLQPGMSSLRGGKISIGPEGSGTRVLALRLLALNGVDQNFAQLLPLTAAQAADALLGGEIDAAAMVTSWDSPAVRRLLGSSDISLASFPRADAYVALHPFLNKLVLPMGVGNMATNRPPSDVILVAPKASLIVRKNLHPAIQYLLLEAAAETHSAAGIFQKSGQFPAAETIDVPLSKDARQYYKSGSPFLQRYLPFWLAIFASRLLVLLIPVMGVAYPLARGVPAIYGWSMRRRIFSLYGELKFIEAELENRNGAERAKLLAQLAHVEERANRLKVPTAFAHFLYHLRNHIGLVRERLERSALGTSAAAPR